MIRPLSSLSESRQLLRSGLGLANEQQACKLHIQEIRQAKDAAGWITQQEPPDCANFGLAYFVGKFCTISIRSRNQDFSRHYLCGHKGTLYHG